MMTGMHSFRSSLFISHFEEKACLKMTATSSTPSSSSSLLLCGRAKHAIQETFLNLLNVLVVVFLYPLVALCLLPLRLHREVAKRLAAGDPQLGPILSGTSALYARPSEFNKSVSVLHPLYTFGQSLSLDHISSVFNDKLLSLRSGGGYAFPQMRQRIVARYGYRFWADVVVEGLTTFQPHFRYLDPSDPYRTIRWSELIGINAELIEVPFSPERSPWEVVLVPNVEKEGDPSVKCVVIWRIHHCLADGFSITNMMRALSFTPWEDFTGKGKSVQLEAGKYNTWATHLWAILRAPYHLAKLSFFHVDRNAWVTRARVESRGTVRLTWLPQPLSLAEVKRVASHCRVGVSSVITMLLVGAVERGMLTRGDAVPSKIQIVIAWPLPGHPGVGNHHTAAIIRFRIYSGEPLKTLKAIDAAYSAVRSSNFPLVLHNIVRIAGSLPSNWVKSGGSAPLPVTCWFTNFPASTRTVDMFGVELTGIRSGSTILPGCGPFANCIMYGGKLEFTTGADCAIFPQEEDYHILHFASSFRDTLNSLLQAVEETDCE